jgi:hypothetical protein
MLHFVSRYISLYAIYFSGYSVQKKGRIFVIDKPRHAGWKTMFAHTDKKSTSHHETQKFRLMPKTTATAEDEILEETKPCAIKQLKIWFHPNLTFSFQ